VLNNNYIKKRMKTVDVLLGLQWGDEGKGKIVDFLAPEYDIIARFQGGPNAGHTLEFDGRKHVLHSIPSGIFHPDKINIIGNGVVFDPLIFIKEVEALRSIGLKPEHNLYLAKRAHMILPTHRLLDAAMEAAKGAGKIGSTLKGIGPAYTDKYARQGLRIGDITTKDFAAKYQKIKSAHFAQIKAIGYDSSSFLIDNITFDAYEYIWMESVKALDIFKKVDCETFINEQINLGKTILAEGAQGTLLDIDFGSFPFVTSSHTIAGGACTGLGIAPSSIRKVFGVFKAYCTRVGSGPFPTEQINEDGEMLRKQGNEFGSTTGRPRRCGWLDLPALRYSVMINGVDYLFMMKADVLDGIAQIPVCNKYKIDNQDYTTLPFELSNPDLKPVYEKLKGWEKTNIEDKFIQAALKDYIGYIEAETNVPVSIVSIGPDRTQTILLSDFMK